jgi:serine/threonine protein kinase
MLQRFRQGLLKKGKAHMPPKLALHIARNVASALSVLHSNKIIHRDIKSSNVLIDLDATQESYISTPVVKLCDFDSAVPLLSSSAHTCYLAHRGVPSANVCVGTPRWIAPEVLRAMYALHSYGLVSTQIVSTFCFLGIVVFFFIQRVSVSFSLVTLQDSFDFLYWTLTTKCGNVAVRTSSSVVT